MTGEEFVVVVLMMAQVLEGRRSAASAMSLKAQLSSKKTIRCESTQSKVCKMCYCMRSCSAFFLFSICGCIIFYSSICGCIICCISFTTNCSAPRTNEEEGRDGIIR